MEIYFVGICNFVWRYVLLGFVILYGDIFCWDSIIFGGLTRELVQALLRIQKNLSPQNSVYLAFYKSNNL